MIDKNIIESFKKYDEVKDIEASNKEDETPISIDNLTLYNDAVMTAYDAFCSGCIGITASGYSVKNTSVYYDSDYKTVSIVAADKSIPFGSIIEFVINNKKLIAIVLDRGGMIGKTSRSQFDLLMDNRNDAYQFGVKKIKYRIIRNGF